MSTRAKFWLSIAVFLVAVQAAIAFGIPRGSTFHLFNRTISGSVIQTTFGDLAQFAIVSFTAVVMFLNALRARGSARIFWFLMSLGVIFWTADLGIWAYYEVLIRAEVPHLTIGDTFLFLHLVPMIAALGAVPDQPTNVGRHHTWLDFAVLLTYWLYFYALLVMPYQYVNPDLPTYNYNFDIIDKSGHWILVVVLFIAFVRAHGAWRRLYLLLTLASLSYAVFSDIANLAVDTDSYYTGSPYDILLIATMCFFAYAALEGRWMQPEHADSFTSPEPEIPKRALQWPALIAMVVTASTPVIGVYLLRSAPHMNPSVRNFRLIITLLAMVMLVFLVFLKQTLLQYDLVRSLSGVSEAFLDLKRVKNQLVQSEKLASMGRLLAGAAHEINNPLTAILGYSDLIATSANGNDEARTMAEKIAQQARRTKMLVEDLLKFSQETPTQRSVNDVHVLVQNAIKIAGLESLNPISVEVTNREHLPQVVVDPGQILQVFVHLIRNAADAMRDSSVRVLHISTRAGSNQVQIEFADSGAGVKDPDLVFDPFYTTKSPGKGTGLGLSACYGIIQKHGGQITCQNRPQGGAIFTVTLPAAQMAELQNA